MEILDQFGIQPVLLLAQIVNFLIILVVLKKFFYKPIVKMLDDRKAKIAESLKNADQISEKLQKTEEKTAEILEKARSQSQEIISQAKTESQRIFDEATKESKEAGEQILARTRLEIAKEKEAMKQEIEKDTMILVTGVVQKVLAKTLKPAEKQNLTQKAISEMSKSVS